MDVHGIRLNTGSPSKHLAFGTHFTQWLMMNSLEFSKSPKQVLETAQFVAVGFNQVFGGRFLVPASMA